MLIIADVNAVFRANEWVVVLKKTLGEVDAFLVDDLVIRAVSDISASRVR